MVRLPMFIHHVLKLKFQDYANKKSWSIINVIQISPIRSGLAWDAG